MKILSIGNSFSEDATRYLHQVAKCGGVEMRVVNLYIGGCPLSLHHRNIMGDRRAYDLQVNGVSTGFPMSVKEALLNDDWDFVTVQQVSSKSFDYSSYQPYLNVLYDYIKKYCPKAEILIHETWGYKPDGDALKSRGFKTHSEMFKKVDEAYEMASVELGLRRIPAGYAIENLVKNGIENSHRDDIHASLGVGRLTLAFTWYEFLTGNSVNEINLSEYDEPIDERELVIAKISAHDAVETIKNK